jgi:hypothetical protein
VQCAGDDGRDESLRVEGLESVFEDGFACAGLTHDEAEAALLAVDAQGIEDGLLMRQEFDFLRVEGISGQSEVGFDHWSIPFCCVQVLLESVFVVSEAWSVSVPPAGG